MPQGWTEPGSSPTQQGGRDGASSLFPSAIPISASPSCGGVNYGQNDADQSLYRRCLEGTGTQDLWRIELGVTLVEF